MGNNSAPRFEPFNRVDDGIKGAVWKADANAGTDFSFIHVFVVLFTKKALEILVREGHVSREGIDRVVNASVGAFAPAVDELPVIDEKRLFVSRVFKEFDVDFHVLISCLFLLPMKGLFSIGVTNGHPRGCFVLISLP